MATNFSDSSVFPFRRGSSPSELIWTRVSWWPWTSSHLRWHCLSASISSKATWKPSPSISDSPFLNHLPIFVLSCLLLTKAGKISNIYLAWLRKALATWKLSSKARWASLLRYSKAPPPPPASSDLVVRYLHLTSWLQLERTTFLTHPWRENPRILAPLLPSISLLS